MVSARGGEVRPLSANIKSKYGLLLLGLLVLVWSAPQLVGRVFSNLASVTTTRAAFQNEAWQTAESAWLTALAFDPTSALAHDGLFRFFRAWSEVQPHSVLVSAQRLARQSGVPAHGSDTLAYLGDQFRGQGQLDLASAFYGTALARNDFSSVDIANASRFLGSVIDGRRADNLVRNSGFDGLTNWSIVGSPSPYVDNGAVRLKCAECRLEQSLPIFGRGVYRLILEVRSDDVSGILSVQLKPSADQNWNLHRQINLSQDWKTYAEWVYIPESISPALDLALMPQDSRGVWLRNVRFEWVDAPAQENWLINASFDRAKLADVSGTDDEFPAWDEAVFWNEFQARGWRKAVPGNDSANALELALTQADGYPHRIGLQQDCGDVAPGTRLELQADLFVPHILQGVYAEVAAVIYSPVGASTPVDLYSQQRKATHGWERLTVTAQASSQPGYYRCMFIVQLVA